MGCGNGIKPGIHSFAFLTVCTSLCTVRTGDNVKSKETVQTLVPFAKFTGTTVLHCHILEHEERGMIGVIEIVSGQRADTKTKILLNQ
ncbi:MAG: multicopper oxidase domain-containing protein [Acaryochloridaceae cyanobacterium RU_4_10]|nr:multicopper oxidase domain-containing protein [Acaryochloridaceae cyanobacterium RU_4_10]